MKLQRLVVLVPSFALMLFASPIAIAEDCDAALRSGTSIATVIEMVLAALNPTPVPQQEIDVDLQSVLTGFPVRRLLEHAGPGDFVHRLMPVSSWRHLAKYLDWQGHLYDEKSNWLRTVVSNTFWGRPLNLRPEDHMALALRAQIGGGAVASMVIGPMNAEGFTPLQTALAQVADGLQAKKISIPTQAGRFDYLLIDGIQAQGNSYVFARRLIEKMQDRYLDGN